jgi:hypothetical protein
MAPPDDDVAADSVDDEHPLVSSEAAATIVAATVVLVLIALFCPRSAVDRPPSAYQICLAVFPDRQECMPAARVPQSLGSVLRPGDFPGKAGSFAVPRNRGKRRAGTCLESSIAAVSCERAGC